VTTDNGMVKLLDGKYYLTPNKPSSSNVMIKLLNGKEYYLAFPVKPIPEIHLRFCKESGYAITSFKNIICLKIYIPEINFTVYPEIISFRVVLKRNNTTIEEHGNKGQTFDDTTRRIVNSCIKYDTLIFDNAWVQFENGNTQKIEPVDFLVNFDPE
jgi:hypothetical protein